MRSVTALLMLMVVAFAANAQLFTPTGTVSTGTNSSIGINTSTPQFPLELVGWGQLIRNAGTNTYTTFRMYNNQNSALRALEFDYASSDFTGQLVNGGVTGEAGALTTTGAYPLMFGTNNTARMTIGSSGNVGIGTNNPAQQFEVVNGVRAVSFNNAISGVTTGGILAISRPGDGMKTMFFGPSAAPATDNVIYGSGGGAELRLVSGGFTSGGFGFYINMTNSTAFASARPTPVMKIDGLGNVGIGDDTPDAKLAVNGTVRSKEVIVTTTGGWPDYVFGATYKLPSLASVEKFIHENQRLPEVPSASEVEKNGQNVGNMNALLLKKIEELTLYVINQQKEIEELKAIIKK